MSLLEVSDLRVHFETEDGVVQAVDTISFEVASGETLGIVGESGCGKSVASMTILGLTRGPQTTISGRVMYGGRDLLSLGAADLQQVRGNDIAMIFQDPLSSLHPFYRIGDQIVEAIRVHRDVSRASARARAIELLGLVGVPEPSRRVDDYPHEFSGGMRQRAMIAMALANEPKLLIADDWSCTQGGSSRRGPSTRSSTTLGTHTRGACSVRCRASTCTTATSCPRSRVSRPLCWRRPRAAISGLESQLADSPDHRDRCWLNTEQKRQYRTVDGRIGLRAPEARAS
jgi:ABC-type dipeptide/oligopeptide/nickel transport system ATPase subunit